MNMKKKIQTFCHVLSWYWISLVMADVWDIRYLDRKIPDEIQISRGKRNRSVQKFCQHPFVTFEEAVTVSQDGGYILPCKLLGYIPFKEIKVTPVDDQETVYVSGSTIGIYMETEGVLVIDTGEIQDRRW